ncbi:hypothetical protein D3C78_1466810 [compost metagenome]
MVDLAHGLVRLVHGVNEGNANEARTHVELGHEGFAESFGRDARAVGDQEYGARVHGVREGRKKGARRAGNGREPTMAPIIPNFMSMLVAGLQPEQQSSVQRSVDLCPCPQGGRRAIPVLTLELSHVRTV